MLPDPKAASTDSTAVAKPDTVAQCHELIEALSQQIDELRLRLVRQDEQLMLLAERLQLNSRNSSKPPSSDGPAGGNRAQRRASARQRGAQKGHPGKCRAMLEPSQLDRIIDCAPPEICDCGAPVQRLADEPIRHQVFDVPPVRAQVHEYRRWAGGCTRCGKAWRAPLPAGVPSGQIGPRALALIGVLGTRFHLTQFKIRDLLAQLMGLDFSVGAISQAHGKVAAALAAPVQQATRSLRHAPVVHMDETHYGREGSTGNWVWAAVQRQLAVFSVLPSRARYVIHELIGHTPQAIVVSDRYAGYAFVDAQRRQICWAHLLRDFQRIAERPGTPGRIGQRLLGLGYVMFRWRERGRTVEQFAPLQRRIRQTLQRGAAQSQCRRTAATCANVLKLWSALWSFLSHAGVQPTNNTAEQALRSIVLKRKISGPTRSRRGDEFIAHGFSAYESCRRQGRDFIAYMHSAVVAWIDKAAAPSLMPTPGAAAPSG